MRNQGSRCIAAALALGLALAGLSAAQVEDVADVEAGAEVEAEAAQDVNLESEEVLLATALQSEENGVAEEEETFAEQEAQTFFDQDPLLEKQFGVLLGIDREEEALAAEQGLFGEDAALEREFGEGGLAGEDPLMEERFALLLGIEAQEGGLAEEEGVMGEETELPAEQDVLGQETAGIEGGEEEFEQGDQEPPASEVVAP